MSRLNILMACVAADGHYRPLTGMAQYLHEQGHDVRWYAPSIYGKEITEMGIQHYPYAEAKEYNANELDKHFPEREKLKGIIAKLNFDIVNLFLKRGPEYLADIKAINRKFPIDIVICDFGFSGIPYIKDKLGIPVIAVSVFPFPGTSKGLPPYGLGLKPASNIFQKAAHAFLHVLFRHVLFRKSNKAMDKMFREDHINGEGANVFDIAWVKADLVFQSGTPSFDYPRKDLSPKVRFVGPILPAMRPTSIDTDLIQTLESYKKVVLITQGTVEKDVTKLMVPALEAFKDHSDMLVVCTTGGAETEKLQQQYNQPNYLIRDFIPYDQIMPYVDVYISNGGYGGVLQSINHGVPMVVAGVHEGKNEICARVGYLGYGVNLKTERPQPAAIARAVEELFGNPKYKNNVNRLRKEFLAKDVFNEIESCIEEVVIRKTIVRTLVLN